MGTSTRIIITPSVPAFDASLALHPRMAFATSLIGPRGGSWDTHAALATLIPEQAERSTATVAQYTEYEGHVTSTSCDSRRPKFYRHV